jgi:hypothetical protein
MSSSLTPANIKQVQKLLEISSKNAPTTPAWADAETELSGLLFDFAPRHTPKKKERLLIYSSGIVEILTSILQEPTEKHQDETLEASWAILNSAMTDQDQNEKDNMETLRKGVNAGLIELATKELQYSPLRVHGSLMNYAFMALTEPCLYSEFAPRVMSSGAAVACVEFIRRDGGLLQQNPMIKQNINKAIATLNSCTRHQLVALRSVNGIAQAMYPFLPLLNREVDDSLVIIGFTAARLLIRLYGKDETSKVIEDNPVILEFYPKFIRKLMDVGAAKNYHLYGKVWVLAGISFDLSLMSKSDTLKKNGSLVPFCPLLIEMLAHHYNHDVELMQHGIVFLSQVSFDEACLAALVKDKKLIKDIQGIILGDKSFDKEILSLLSVVMNAVFPPSPTEAPSTTTTTRRTSAFKKATSLVFGGGSSSTTTTTATTTTANNTTNVQIQAMISYHQKSTGQHAQTLASILKKRNVKVWIDVNDMKGDIQEAMAQAVQSSDIILVLVSVGYKESANCRLECQYAMKQNKPIFFLVCEQSYTSPTGWLGLIMGQRMWVGIFTPAMVENKAEEVERRLHEVLNGDDITSSSSNSDGMGIVTTTTTTTTPKSPSGGEQFHGHTISETISNLVKEITNLKTKVDKVELLENELSTLKLDYNVLKTNYDALKEKVDTLGNNKE